MKVEHVLAVIAVSDIEASARWYGRLFDRAPDNHPMPVLYEWQIAPGGWVQVTMDSERAGTSQLNLAIADLDADVAEISERGIAVGEIAQANRGVRLAPIEDLDGNVITLIGGFRPVY